MFDHKVTTLLTLISTGSYTKAAERLNLTQPAVSHQIRLLESEFGIKIFYFDKKELKLTPEGAILASMPEERRLFIPMHCRQLMIIIQA